MATNHNTQYNIPRVQVQMPGRQNRLSDGEFNISPTMTEPVKFLFGNQDGVPLLMHNFSLQFVVWEYMPLRSNELAMSQSSILINKRIFTDSPYLAEVEMILTEDETMKLGHHASGQILHWSLFMINEEGQVFPLQVSNSGGRYGTICIDLAGSMPIAELIRNPSS